MIIEIYAMEYSTLYKYLDAAGAELMLKNRTLQFTNATKLNDPFDCHPSLIDFSKVPSERCKVWSPEDIQLLESDRYRRYREEAWICSLSKVFDSILMWSYYNKHEGVCIGLDIGKTTKYLDVRHGMMVFNSGYEVKYRDIIEKPDYFRSIDDFFHYQMCTKAKEWEHEQEVRMFILDPSPMYMALPYKPKDKKQVIDWKEVRSYPRIGGECFDSIYIGVNIDQKIKTKILELSRKLNPDIKIYQMTVNPDAFKLDAVAINY